MVEIPEAAVRAAKRAFAGRGPDREGGYALDTRRNPWDALDDALRAVAPLIGRAYAAAELERFADGREKFAKEVRLRTPFDGTADSFAAGIEHDALAARNRAWDLRGGHDGSGT